MTKLGGHAGGSEQAPRGLSTRTRPRRTPLQAPPARPGGQFSRLLEKLDRSVLIDGVTMSGSLDSTPGSTAVTGSAEVVLRVFAPVPGG